MPKSQKKRVVFLRGNVPLARDLETPHVNPSVSNHVIGGPPVAVSRLHYATDVSTRPAALQRAQAEVAAASAYHRDARSRGPSMVFDAEVGGVNGRYIP